MLVGGALPREFGADLAQAEIEAALVDDGATEITPPPAAALEVAKIVILVNGVNIATPVASGVELADDLPPADLDLRGLVALAAEEGHQHAADVVVFDPDAQTFAGPLRIQTPQVSVQPPTDRPAVGSDVPKFVVQPSLQTLSAFVFTKSDAIGQHAGSADDALFQLSAASIDRLPSVSVSKAFLDQNLLSVSGNLVLGAHISTETLTNLAAKLSPGDPTILLTALRMKPTAAELEELPPQPPVAPPADVPNEPNEPAEPKDTK